MQKPEAIVSLREAAPVVLTQTAGRMGTIALPQARGVVIEPERVVLASHL